MRFLRKPYFVLAVHQPAAAVCLQLNLVERFFSDLSVKWIKRGAHTSVNELESSIRTYIERHNVDPKPFVGRKGADEILGSVTRAAKKLASINER